MVFLPSFAIGRSIDHVGTFFVVQAAALALSRLIVAPWTARTSARSVVSVNLLALGIALDLGIGADAAGWGLLSDIVGMRPIFLLAGSLALIALPVFGYMQKKTSPSLQGLMSSWYKLLAVRRFP